MKIACILLLVAAVGLPTSAGAQSQSSLCRGLKAEDRTACLKAEYERGQRELAEIEKRNRRLDAAKKAVCTVTRSSLAGAVGGAIGDAALRQKHTCTKRAQ